MTRSMPTHAKRTPPSRRFSEAAPRRAVPPSLIPWTLTGLTPNASYDMIWYNKRESPGETRHPNTGVTGFDAGSGVGASGPLDADRDQNFVGVQADATGTISGTWFLAGGAQDITAVAGVQVTAGNGLVIPEPSTFLLAALGLSGLMGFGRRRRR